MFGIFYKQNGIITNLEVITMIWIYIVIAIIIVVLFIKLLLKKTENPNTNSSLSLKEKEELREDYLTHGGHDDREDNNDI